MFFVCRGSCEGVKRGTAVGRIGLWLVAVGFGWCAFVAGVCGVEQSQVVPHRYDRSFDWVAHSTVATRLDSTQGAQRSVKISSAVKLSRASSCRTNHAAVLVLVLLFIDRAAVLVHDGCMMVVVMLMCGGLKPAFT